jgi:aminomethyltransferase
MSASALRTALHALHVALGARMVRFAGWDMPVQYPSGILAEHAHTRSACSLFDVSHMGQLALAGDERIAALERLVPGDIAGLALGRMRYTMLTHDRGGIIDDLMVTNQGERLFLVVNAAQRDADVAHLRAHLPATCPLSELPDRALLALQGPLAAAVVARHAPGAESLPFLASGGFAIAGVPVVGYTGEDGFEISVPASEAERLARLFLGEKEVAPAGLGARDTLRLEAGLCLYGHDIDETTSPVEAGLAWSIARRRRDGGGFPGAAIVARHLAEGAPRQRVGIALDGRVPARDGNAIVALSGRPIGATTSGGYGPTVGAPIAMGYVEAAHAAPGTPVAVIVRDAARPGRVVPLPFVPHRYARSAR